MWTIGSFRGVKLKLHVLFLVVLGVFVVAGRPWGVLQLSLIVLLHEVAHGLAARHHGIAVREIVLLPVGGVARIEGMIEIHPVAERNVALAGPLANGILAGLAWAAMTYELLPRDHLTFFLQANAALAGFNLLPALPLDGGRVYRALLARRLGFSEATERAVHLSKGIALLLFVLGIVGLSAGIVTFTAAALAAYVFWGARKEQADALYILMRYLAHKHEELEEEGWLPTEQIVAGPHVPVMVIVRRFIPRRYHVVWVVDPLGAINGVLSEQQIIDGLFGRGGDTPLGELLVDRRRSPG